MQLQLTPHPDTPCDAIDRVEVEVVRFSYFGIKVRYRMVGRIDEVLLPPKVKPARTDELWRHTCFELFIWIAEGAGYYEFNLSPSEAWAAFEFKGYREGMGVMGGIGAWPIETEAGPDSYELRSSIDFGVSLDLPAREPWVVGLSAVIEQKDGRISYWALKHPPGRPDFHHPDNFALAQPSEDLP